MEDEAIVGFPIKEEYKGHYISNLVSNVEGMQRYSTTRMLNEYNNVISDEQVEQIKHLGVQYRYLARPLVQYHYDFELQVHRDYLLNAARKCMMDTSLDINNLIVASEIADYQTPGIAATLLPALGFSKFAQVYNLQGTACSSMPRVLELAQNLKGNTLCIISGITSDMYQTELAKIKSEIKPKSKEWVKLMFAFLFGDATVAFIVNKDGDQLGRNYKILRQSHVMNLGPHDYKRAAVFRNGDGFDMYANPEINQKALHYTDVVLTKMGIETFGHYDSIVLHTGSRKIIRGYSDYYNYRTGQLYAAINTLENYGNTTGCSLPLVLNKADINGKALMIGITMGFGVDIVEVTTD